MTAQPSPQSPAANSPAASASAVAEQPTAADEAPRRRLGLGLNALLGGSGPAPAAAAAGEEVGEMQMVPVEAVEANPLQPRRHFDAEELAELTGSVREHGVLQPLLVREIAGGFQLVAGERRLKAARKAGLATVPVRVVDVVDQTAYEFALEENLKRSDLNAMEKARAFRAYLDQFQMSSEDLARQLSMSSSAVKNTLRLLDLPESAQAALSEGRISPGHAKAILMAPGDADRMELCGRIQAEKLNVRQAETEARGYKERAAAGDSPETISFAQEKAKTDAKKSKNDRFLTPHVKEMEQRIRDRMGVKTEIRLTAKEKGRVVLQFASSEEFEQLVGKLAGDEPQAVRVAA